jgi:hypothetical protein
MSIDGSTYQPLAPAGSSPESLRQSETVCSKCSEPITLTITSLTPPANLLCDKCKKSNN